MTNQRKILFLASALALFVIVGCSRSPRPFYGGPDETIVQTMVVTVTITVSPTHTFRPTTIKRDIPIKPTPTSTSAMTSGKRDIPIKQPVNASPTPVPTPIPPPDAGRKVELPEDIATATFDQLWFVSRQWEVGSYKDIVRAARLEINRRGKDVLQNVLAELPVESGLEQRAFIEYFRSLGDDAAEPLVALLETNHKYDALSLIVTINLKAAIPGLQKWNAPDDFGHVVCRVLATLGDKTVLPALMQQYAEAGELLKLRILGSVKGMKEPSLLGFFINECGSDLVSIRRMAQNCILAIGVPALPDILIAMPEAETQKYRCLLEVLGMIGTTECAIVLLGKTDLKNTPDWRIRFSALRALQSCKLTDDDKKFLAVRMKQEDVIFCRREYSRLLTEEIEWKMQKRENK